MTKFSFTRVFSILILLLLIAPVNLRQVQTASAIVDIFAAQNFHSSSVEDDIIQCVIPLCTGTDENDIIIGSFLNETIFGLKGDDKIQSNDGDDIVLGGDGNDVIEGGDSFDKLFGNDGDDVIISDAELSLIGPQIFDEVIINDRFNDLLLGIGASSPVNSGQLSSNVTNQSDVFASEIPDDILSMRISLLDGGKGDDNLIGASGNEFFVGGPGHDYFNCNEGFDTVLDFNPKEDTADANCDVLE